MKNKRSLIIVCIVLLVMMLFLLNNNNYQKEFNVNIGDEIPTSVVFHDKNIDLVWDNVIAKNNKVYNFGSFSGYFKYLFKKYEVTLKVIDNEKPTLSNYKDISIIVNEEPDFYSSLSSEDNSHDELDIKVLGDYDVSRVGTYKLKYVIKDKANNANEYDFNLIVKAKENPKLGKLVETTSKGYNIYLKNDCYYIEGIIIANKSYPLPSTYAPGENKEAKNELLKLISDAKDEGISYFIDNGYRSYQTQKYLYQRWVNTLGFEEAERVSARPGYSEHQTGYSFDVVDEYRSLNTNMGDRLSGKWLSDNAPKYGFIIRYVQNKESITGYSYEPWHIRYVGKSLAEKLYNNGDWLTIEEYFGITSEYK